MSFYPDERFADLRELGRALSSVSGRRAWWGRGGGLDPSLAEPASFKPWASRRGSFVPAPRSKRRLGSAIGATVLACSIAAPLVAWCSVRRHRALSPVVVTSALERGGALPQLSAPPASSSCATPCLAPSSSRPAAPALDSAAPASSAPAHAAQPTAAVVQTATAALIPAAVIPAAVIPAAVIPAAVIPAALPPSAAPPAPFASTASPGVFAAPGAPGGEAAPSGEAGEPVLRAASGSDETAESRLSVPADAGGVDAGNTAQTPPPSVTATPSRQDRGTNGALIFD